MPTPQDGLANVVADVSFNIDGGGVLTTPARFQVAGIAAPVGGAVGVTPSFFGISRISAGIVDVAIDLGKGAGPVVVGTSFQCEFDVAFTGFVLAGTEPMMWTVAEGAASTSNNRIYRFHFFRAVIATSQVVLADPVQCTITIRRKKELLPS